MNPLRQKFFSLWTLLAYTATGIPTDVSRSLTPIATRLYLKSAVVAGISNCARAPSRVHADIRGCALVVGWAWLALAGRY